MRSCKGRLWVKVGQSFHQSVSSGLCFCLKIQADGEEGGVRAGEVTEGAPALILLPWGLTQHPPPLRGQ